MSPDTSNFVMAVNRALKTEPNLRTSIRRMHAANYPLVKMVDALGLEEGMSQAIRKIVEGLSPSVVESIRRATLDMLNRADAVDDPNYEMPLQCKVSDEALDSGAPVEVEVEDMNGVQTIYVQQATAS